MGWLSRDFDLRIFDYLHLARHVDLPSVYFPQNVDISHVQLLQKVVLLFEDSKLELLVLFDGPVFYLNRLG